MALFDQVGKSSTETSCGIYIHYAKYLPSESLNGQIRHYGFVGLHFVVHSTCPYVLRVHGQGVFISESGENFLPPSLALL